MPDTADRGLRLGVNLMPHGWVDRPTVTGPALMKQRARLLCRMQTAGLDHAMVGDHVMFHDGIGNDALIDASSILTATEKLDVYIAVYLLVLRHPLPVARQIVTLAQYAPGRLTLGLGIGGDDRREVLACGIDPKTRGRRMDECLTVLRDLLAGKTVNHHGDHVDLADARLQPTPEKPIPLIVGGRSDAALRRAGRLGDGWLGIWTTAARSTDAITTVEDQARDAGRTDVDWHHGMTFWCGFGADPAAGHQRVGPAMQQLYRTAYDKFARYVPAGTPAQVAEYLAPYLDAGITTINLIPFATSDEAAIDAAAEVRDLLS
jgi:alkanesulfonate monooxygenase SsuD/methylene tetrahydromethanopterin reductase-like flavin-dependent oxidoreductase (luciferase family)